MRRYLRVLKIVPSVAEYWDRGGAIASTVKMVKAALTGSEPDEFERKSQKVLSTKQRCRRTPVRLTRTAEPL